MTKIEIQNEIIRIRNIINNYNNKKQVAKNEISELEELYNRLAQSKRSVEDRLDQTLSVIKSKSSKLSQYSKLRNTYVEEARKILKNSNSSTGLAKLQNGMNKSKNKIQSLEASVNSYNNQIRYYENKLNALKQQLAQMGD